MSKIFKHQNTKGNFLSRGTDEKLEMLCSTNDKLLDKAVSPSSARSICCLVFMYSM